MPSMGLKKLALNSLSTMGRQVTSGLLQILTLALIGRHFGPDGSGIYTLAILLPTLLATFLNLGLGSANVYYLASGKMSPSQSWLTTCKLNSVIVLLGFLAGSLVIIFGRESWLKEVPIGLLWVSLLFFPLVLFTGSIGSVFQGMQEFKKYNRIVLLQPVLTFLFISLAIYLQIEDLVLVCSLYFISLSITQIIAFVYLKPYIRKGEKTFDQDFRYKLLRYGYKAHLSDILAFLNYRSDIVLLAHFIGSHAVGIYSVAVTLVEKLWLFSQGISTVLLPRLAQLNTDTALRNRLTSLVARGVLWFTLFFAILLSLVGILLLEIIFGEEFLPSYNVILILLPGIVVGSMSRVLANAMAAMGRPGLNLATSWITVILNVMLNIYLIPTHGVEGAAIATTIAYTVNAVMRLFVFSYVTNTRFLQNLLLQREDIHLVKQIYKKFVYR